MQTQRISSPHLKPPIQVTDIMKGVIYALIPGIAVMFWLYGWSFIINIFIAISSALIFEAIALYLRQRPVKIYLYDGSALLTAILIALAIPTLVPWWIVVLGSFFAIVMTKQLYGGLGYNVFNPAMVAYAILLISFPEQMSILWQNISNEGQSLNLIDSINFKFFNELPADISIDAITSATPLDSIKTILSSGAATVSELKSQSFDNNIYGVIAGSNVEWINLAFLAGGLWMIYTKLITWHIPVSMLLSLLICSLLLGYGIDSDLHPSPLFHLFTGASMLGAFFIATDPVSASTTPKGKIVFGAGIGCLIYAIRTWGGYPDAIAFAVILMNITVPVIDYYTQPRVYGHDK
ncbi:MAG: electron transport complex subunit RsxD [Gammaproteobacteria bacterium]|nr:electron transport complex subunit RsxD [Gammaproteobacteria bacterium]